MATARAIPSARAAEKAVLLVGGTPVASLARFTGGEPFADVVDEPGGLLPYAKKHVGDLHFADVEALVSMDAHPSLYRWIRDAWFGNPARDKVSLRPVEGARVKPFTLELANARIREVVLPALDHASRDRGFLTLRMAPRGARRVASGGAPEREGQRDFLAHNFDLEIAGLDCSGILSIDAITVTTQLPPDNAPKHKKPILVFPDLHLHVDAEKADSFREWFEDFIIRGNNDDDKERDGSIRYQDPMLGDPLAVLQLFHVGIYRIADEPMDEGPRRVRVDLYCERMELTASGALSGDTDQLPPVKV